MEIWGRFLMNVALRDLSWMPGIWRKGGDENTVLEGMSRVHSAAMKEAQKHESTEVLDLYGPF